MIKKMIATVVMLSVTALAFGVDFPSTIEHDGRTEDSGTLSLEGFVAQKVAIVVTALDGVANDLDLDGGAPVSNLKIAEVVEFSNLRGDYTIELTSDNNWALSGQAGGDEVAYSLAYNNATWSGESGAATSVTKSGRTGRTGSIEDVTMSYDVADTNLFNDTYTDTVTFTIRVTE